MQLDNLRYFFVNLLYIHPQNNIAIRRRHNFVMVLKHLADIMIELLKITKIKSLNIGKY